MGKGDRKSKKGKLWRKSYGNLRNRNAIKARVKKVSAKKIQKPETPTRAAKPKKTARKKTEA
jgi:ribosomal small subunit protein bTHX